MLVLGRVRVKLKSFTVLFNFQTQLPALFPGATSPSPPWRFRRRRTSQTPNGEIGAATREKTGGFQTAWTLSLLKRKEAAAARTSGLIDDDDDDDDESKGSARGSTKQGMGRGRGIQFGLKMMLGIELRCFYLNLSSATFTSPHPSMLVINNNLPSTPPKKQQHPHPTASHAKSHWQHSIPSNPWILKHFSFIHKKWWCLRKTPPKNIRILKGAAVFLNFPHISVGKIGLGWFWGINYICFLMPLLKANNMWPP